MIRGLYLGWQPEFPHRGMAPVPANTHGGVFSPILVSVGEFIPVGNPAENLSLLEIQYLKINLN
jgi:hypothetical protein